MRTVITNKLLIEVCFYCVKFENNNDSEYLTKSKFN